jgi:hypothetical protein
MSARYIINDRGNQVNKESAPEIERGRMYTQALLNELSLGDLDTWVKQIAHAADSDAALADGTTQLFGQLLTKVTADGKWTNLPASAIGGSLRDIAANVPKIISMALRDALNAARRETTGRKVPVGYFQTFGSFSECEKQLKKKGADQAVASGTEAKQRRERELFDHEQYAHVLQPSLPPK